MSIKETLGDRVRLRRTELGLSQDKLAKAVGVSQGLIAQIEAGTNGGTKHMVALSEALLVSPSWLEKGGNREALPVNMDALSAGPKIHGKLPLISWVRAGELCEAPDNFQPGDAEEWLDCPVKHGPNAYCLRVKGDSMDDGTAGGYRDGEIIFIDPAIGAVAGHDVVVRTPDGKTTFKRLKRDQDGLYLLGLNGKKIIRVPEGTVFCGVVIFSGIKR